jgi:glutamate carboxypeptidase
MPTTREAEAISAYLEQRLETYVEELRALCAIECPTSHKAGVDEAGAWVRRWCQARGWALRDWPDAGVGDSLVATLRGGDPAGARVMLVAHLDTVYPVGVAAQRPLRAEGERLLGPGSADNKGGLLTGLYAMAALEDLGLLGTFATVGMVCGGDEETDMRSSLELLRELAPSYDVALVLEPARENGCLVGARKGSGHFQLRVQGIAAHAGVEPHKGASAIVALAQQIVALHLLNGMRPGTTVNAGVIGGGTVSNAIAAEAWADLDVRVALAEDMEPVGAALARIAATPYVPGTSAVLEGGWRLPPMARTPQIAALAELARACAGELGFEVEDTATGGLSYANPLAGLGLPVLDGLGPVGGRAHSPDEFIVSASIVPRTALLALLMLREAETRRGERGG